MTWILPKQLHTLACALDTEALSLDLNEQSQVCAQSLFVRSKPLPLRIWLRKWNRDNWSQHLSGRILRPSLGNRFATEWTSLLGATHASPSVQQGNAEARTTRGTCGRLLQMAFDFSDPGSASLRTSKDISAWGCPTSLKTWQEWVIERRGAYSARLKLAHRTSESGCSSWPTISVNESKNSIGGSQMERNSIPLGTMAAMHGPAAPASSSTDGSRPELWHTPTQAPEAPNINSRRAVREGRQPKGQQHSLLAQAQWQTATVSTGAHQQKDGSMTDKLDRQVKNWATARSGMARGNKFTYDRGKGNIEEQAGASVQGGGKLNPRWVETLMGLPVGWTMPSCVSPVTIERMSCDSLETVLYRQQRNEPSEH